MTDIKNYGCLERYNGKCSECKVIRHNVDCPRYYPIFMCQGEALIPHENLKDLIKNMELEWLKKSYSVNKIKRFVDEKV